MIRFSARAKVLVAIASLTAYICLWIHQYGKGIASEVQNSRVVSAPAVERRSPSQSGSIIYPMGPRLYQCKKINRPIVVSGRGDDPGWASATWSDYFVDIEGDKKPEPRFHTRMKMLWNDQYLYVYAELEEPHVCGTLTQKNSIIFHDNDFEVFIDPDSSGENYYEYEMNALNTIWELTLVKRYTKGGPAILGTNLPGLIRRTFVDGTLNDPDDVDHGWSVEIAFPFKGLANHRRNGPCPPVAGDQWRINFSRVEWMYDIVDGNYSKIKRPEDNWVWTPQGIVDMHQPEHWGFLNFVQ